MTSVFGQTVFKKPSATLWGHSRRPMKKCVGQRTDPSQWPTPIRHASKQLFCPKDFLTCVKPLILEARPSISDHSLWDCTLTWQNLSISIWCHMGLKLCLKCLPTLMCSMHPCYWTPSFQPFFLTISFYFHFSIPSVTARLWLLIASPIPLCLAACLSATLETFAT